VCFIRYLDIKIVLHATISILKRNKNKFFFFFSLFIKALIEIGRKKKGVNHAS